MERTKNRPIGLTYRKKPNERQKTVLATALKNRGKMQPAMEVAGYSKQTSKNPINLTNTKSWGELLNQYLPNDLLIKMTLEGLRATIPVGNTGECLPNHAIRHRYLETALKIKGKLAPKTDNDTVEQRIVGITYVVPKGVSVEDVKEMNEQERERVAHMKKHLNQ